MKLFLTVIFVAIGANAQTEEQSALITQHVTVCSQKVNITEDDGSKFLFNEITEDKEEYKCFAKCFMERTGFMDEDGEFQKDVIAGKLSIGLGLAEDSEIMKNLDTHIDDCVKLTGPGECGTAFEVHNCYWKKVKEVLLNNYTRKLNFATVI